MTKGMLARWRAAFGDERGVAMVTALFVGAAMTAVTSVAAFATIQEFKQGRDDRKAVEALSYAEAGIDRFIRYLRSGTVNYNDMNQAGCNGRAPLSLPSGKVGNGQFTVTMSVYNPFASTAAGKVAPAACSNRPVTPHPGQNAEATYFLLTSTGTHPDATRVIRQVISVEPLGLPVGLYANNFILKAHPTYNNMSMQTRGIITDRRSDSFTGLDSYYKMQDFFPDGVSGRSPSEPVPAAAHAGGGIFLSLSSNPEFTGGLLGTKNCSADRTFGRSLWDSDGTEGAGAITSGCVPAEPGQSGYPRSSFYRFKAPPPVDHDTLRDSALSSGIFCSFPGAGGTGGTTCSTQGNPWTYTQANFVAQLAVLKAAVVHNMIVYIEYRAGTPFDNNFAWDGSVWGCNTNPDLNWSVTVDIRNGGFSDIGAGGDMVNGAIFTDGDFNTTGKMTFDGTINVGGSASFGSSSEIVGLSPCWVQNFPGSFLKVITGQWSEVDR
jgi:hypothetical protein